MGLRELVKWRVMSVPATSLVEKKKKKTRWRKILTLK